MLSHDGHWQQVFPVTQSLLLSCLSWVVPLPLLSLHAGPCQQPQIQHLLRMSGGIIGFDDCEYSPEAWQQQYCM
jgi:hypothetical protein